MPMIDLKASPGALAPADLEALGERLTATLLEHREVPDTPQARDRVWLFAQEIPTLVGGEPAAAPHVVARFSIVEGGMTSEHKAGLMRDATRHVRAASPGAHVWVLIDEVPDGSWGEDGQVTRLADAQRLLGAEAR